MRKILLFFIVRIRDAILKAGWTKKIRVAKLREKSLGPSRGVWRHAPPENFEN